MKFSPYSLHHAPASLPIWHTILDDLGDPHPARVAKVLGLGVRTVYRYNREGRAPRAVCLALFWLTRWGRSAVECQAVNDCQAPSATPTRSSVNCARSAPILPTCSPSASSARPTSRCPTSAALPPAPPEALAPQAPGA